MKSMGWNPKRITSLKQLCAAAQNKKSVYCPSILCFSHHMPAAFAVNLPGIMIQRLLESGLYIYKGNKK
jgi:hypothetical protein